MAGLLDAERLVQTVSTTDATIQFCKDRGLIADAPVCRYCRHTLTWSAKAEVGDGYTWRCTHRGCRKRSRNCSIRHGSWFSDSKMSLKKILKLTYYWAARATTDAAIRKHQPTKVKVHLFSPYPFRIRLFSNFITLRKLPNSGSAYRFCLNLAWYYCVLSHLPSRLYLFFLQGSLHHFLYRLRY